MAYIGRDWNDIQILLGLQFIVLTIRLKIFFPPQKWIILLSTCLPWTATHPFEVYPVSVICLNSLVHLNRTGLTTMHRTRGERRWTGPEVKCQILTSMNQPTAQRSVEKWRHSRSEAQEISSFNYYYQSADLFFFQFIRSSFFRRR